MQGTEAGRDVLAAWRRLQETLDRYWYLEPEAADAATLQFLESLEHWHLRWMLEHLLPDRASR